MPETNATEAQARIIKISNWLNFRYRIFATGFLLGIVLMAVSAYFITPGLAALILTGYMTYFMRVNLMNMEGQRQQLEQTLTYAFNHAQAKKDNAVTDTHKGTYL